MDTLTLGLVRSCNSPNRYGLGFSPQKKGGPQWLDGWAAATGLGSRWAPFMFPFWAPGSDGWAAATGLGFRWPPFMFPFWAPGSDARSWAPIGLPSYFLSGFLSGLLGRMVSRGQEAGLPLGSLHVSFFGAPGSDSHWAPFIFPFRKKVCGGGWMGGPRRRGWACIGHPSCFWAPGAFPFLGRMGGRRRRGGLPLRSLHQWAPFMVPFCSPFPFPLGSLHVSFLGSAAAPFINGLPSCFLFGLLSCLGMGGRRSHWAPFMFPFWGAGSFGLPSCFVFGLPSCSICGSDGWAAATGLGLHWAPFPSGSLSGLQNRMGGPGSDGWAAATGLGLRWAPFPSGSLSGLQNRMGGPGSDGWAAATGWAPFMFPLLPEHSFRSICWRSQI